jgi:outer membrane protein assembly factor BamB
MAGMVRTDVAQQTQQPASPPIAPVPHLAPTPKPKPPPKPAAPQLKFPSVVKWSTTLDAAPVVPPIVAEGRIVLALRSGALSARQLSDGTELWTIKLAVDQTIAADADTIFVVTAGTLHALNAADGSTLWTAEVGKPSAPILARGGWVIAASGGSVTALRGADGEKIWTHATGLVSERPAIDGDRLYLPIAEGRLLALDLKTGNTHWDQPVGGSPTEPLAYGDRIYLGSDTKRFMCLRAASGREDWHHEVGIRIIGPAAADEGQVYFTAMDNILRALSRGNGGQRWRFPLTYRPSKGPVVMGGQVGVPGITVELTGVNAMSGRPTGKLTLPAQLAIGPSFVAPIGTDGLPAVVSITGGLTPQWTLSVSVPPPDEPPAEVAKD